ncbi:MAG: YbhB/YbcL family Raf kinase inhibitor-like protein [Candidatus Babeliaceae bacterium]
MNNLIKGMLMCAIINEMHAFTLMSRAFGPSETIPSLYTCDGANQSPPLAWKNAPKNTKSLALICEDPDAPTPQPFVHWIIGNIPASATQLSEKLPTTEKLENGTVQGRNDAHKTGYYGPCPPSGNHHYHFTLYALESMLQLTQPVTKDMLLNAMQGHIIAQTTLIGTYQKRNKHVKRT